MKKILISIICSIMLFSVVFGQQKSLPDHFDINDVNDFDRLVMNPYSRNLDYAGTVMEGLSILTPAVLYAAPTEDYWKIGVEYAETVALAYGIKELCKLCVSRARPYMYFEGYPENKITEGDWDDSFISGHTTLSFAAASLTSFLFCQYFPESQWKVPVCITAFSLAGATAVLRLSSGNHFMTDVICGAVLGTGIGILVPWLNSLWIKPSYKNENFQMFFSPASFSVQFKF